MTNSRCVARRAFLSLAVVMTTLLSLPATSTQAATINFSSLETVLADPGHMSAKMYALWTAWFTQVYEYNTPFIELAADADDQPITELSLTIGDTAYNFGTEFAGKAWTNASHVGITGQPALLGMTTPGIAFNSFVTDGGDKLVIQFLNGGLQPGQVARFQVDINSDNPADKKANLASYTEVFFDANGGSNIEGNSIVGLGFSNGQTTSVQLPNYDLSDSMMASVSTPRSYNIMQMIDPLVPLNITDPIPEPATALLAALAMLGLGGRRRE
ncbi:PEP-CTERM sorting domain-containing protein [Botrimarina hoheduenensis]|uniref:Ice-binding protein C-terminal domain-containing protein n=1 Tax=Botrimarina hoheduenensis TaxID=2528000 RepID=A0A5C5VXY1_9BACT|nr:PEP-CTERM sorting domain-containing protein [Botrimarina hoheduenensis]TWT43310.1 hypothetical protein Pla111_22610 [Botrimarina hoheduenensis]